MKKLLNLCLLLTFLIGYLEWGKNSHLFIFQAEAELFSKALDKPLEVLHPFILIPFSGQLVLLFTLFQKEPGKVLTFISLACLSLLMLLLFLIGLLEMNSKMIVFNLPFIITGIFIFRHYRKRKTAVQ